MRIKIILNQGKSCIIAKKNMYTLSRNKEKYKYANPMQIMFMNISEVDVKKWISHHVKTNKIYGVV